MSYNTFPSQWTEDLFYNTELPASNLEHPSPISNPENQPSPLSNDRYELSLTSPNGYARTYRRRPLSDLKESPEGKLIMQTDDIVRRFEFRN